MKITNLFTLGAFIGVAATAAAQENPHSNVAVAISALDGEHAIDFALSGVGSELDLHNMQEGENRSIVDDSGRTILVTREADGLRFDVDGKSVKVPAFDGGHHGAVFIGDAASGLDVHVMGKPAGTVSTRTLRAHPMPGTMIMTEKPIDDATRQAIESLLQSAGHDGEVRFMDRERLAHGVGSYELIHEDVEQ